MNSLSIVARAVLMEADEQPQPSRARRYAKNALKLGAGAGLGYGMYRGGQAMVSPFIVPKGRGNVLYPAGMTAAKARVGHAAGAIKGAVMGAPGALKNFASNHATGLKRAGMGMGAAAAGYGAYKLAKHYQAKKAAQAAAKEAYYRTYMSLMESEEGEPESTGSKVKRYAKTALKVGAGAAGLYGAGRVGQGLYRAARYAPEGGKMAAMGAVARHYAGAPIRAVKSAAGAVKRGVARFGKKVTDAAE